MAILVVGAEPKLASATDVETTPMLEAAPVGTLVIRATTEIEVRVRGPGLGERGGNFGKVTKEKRLEFEAGQYEIEFWSGERLRETSIVTLVAGRKREVFWPRKTDQKEAPETARPPERSESRPGDDEWSASDGILGLLDPRKRKKRVKAVVRSRGNPKVTVEGEVQKPEAFFYYQRSDPPLPDSPMDGPPTSLQRTLQQAVSAISEARRQVKAERLAIREAERMRQDETAERLSRDSNKNDEDREARLERFIPQLEDLLVKSRGDSSLLPDVVYVLAELYYLRDTDRYYRAYEAFAQAVDSPDSPSGPEPSADYTSSITLYRRLVTAFPHYRLVDTAYYLLGFSLGEMRQQAQAQQALLSFACANRYQPSPPPTTPPPDDDPYRTCLPLNAHSPVLPEAWNRIGEFHFDATDQLTLAIGAFKRVLEFKDTPYYDRALYKLAWSLYRNNNFSEATRQFDNLMKYADVRAAMGDKVGWELRPEALQYLGVTFAESDWNADGVPDAESPLERLEAFYRGHEAESHVPDVYERLGDVLLDSARYREAIAVYEAAIRKWPSKPVAARAQSKVVRGYVRLNDLMAVARESETLARDYSKESTWWKVNKGNATVTAATQEQLRETLLMAATRVHAGAQACRQASRGRDCRPLYESAVKLYDRYLATTDLQHSSLYALSRCDALYHAGMVSEALESYAALRDADVPARVREDAASMAVRVLESEVQTKAAAGKLVLPEMPSPNGGARVGLIALPDAMKELVSAYDAYVKTVPYSRHAATYALKAATILIQFRDLVRARERLEAVYQGHCREASALEAVRGIAFTYRIEAKPLEEGAWVNRLSDGPCGPDKHP